jgi:hypothetical protein
MVTLDKGETNSMPIPYCEYGKVPRKLDPGTILRPRNEVPWMVKMMTLRLPTVPFPCAYASKLTAVVSREGYLPLQSC